MGVGGGYGLCFVDCGRVFVGEWVGFELVICEGSTLQCRLSFGFLCEAVACRGGSSQSVNRRIWVSVTVVGIARFVGT